MSTASALRAAWAEALDVDIDEIEDDSHFIEIGGDSVMAMKLAGIAPKYGLDLDVEAIFQEGVFKNLLAKTKMRQEPEKSEQISPDVKVDNQLLQTCAEACGLPIDRIEDVYLPSAVSKIFIKTHQESGSWMIQIVFQVDGDLDTPLVCQAFEAIHDRNETFRSRFVEVGSEMQTVVTKEPVAWIHTDNLERYMMEDRSMKIASGQPTVRYALVEESEKTCIVWTALHTAMDGWTRKLLCDDLGAFLQDPVGFLEMPPRPRMRKYLDFITKLDPDTSQSFWDAYLAGAPHFNPPLATHPKVDQPLCTKKMVKKVPIHEHPRTSIRLSTMAHTAFALLIGNITGYDDVVFWVARGLRALFPGAEAIMGLLFSTVPIRVSHQPSTTVRDLLQRVQQDANAMIRHEPLGFKLFPGLEAFREPSISFNWFYKGADLDVRTMRGKGGPGAKEGTLKVVEEKYSPHRFPALLNVYDNGDYLKLSAEYDDRLFPDEFMEDFLTKFSDLFNRICQCKGEEQVKTLLDI
ncbi:MAG: hypothetical protein Q9182_000860 [Xanthomendoza sp. 2 TL-2023]